MDAQAFVFEPEVEAGELKVKASSAKRPLCSQFGVTMGAEARRWPGAQRL